MSKRTQNKKKKRPLPWVPKPVVETPEFVEDTYVQRKGRRGEGSGRFSWVRAGLALGITVLVILAVFVFQSPKQSTQVRPNATISPSAKVPTVAPKTTPSIKPSVISKTP
jgi:hypothetical protein